jgi:hypothetical protein
MMHPETIVSKLEAVLGLSGYLGGHLSYVDGVGIGAGQPVTGG